MTTLRDFERTLLDAAQSLLVSHAETLDLDVTVTRKACLRIELKLRNGGFEMSRVVMAAPMAPPNHFLMIVEKELAVLRSRLDMAVGLANDLQDQLLAEVEQQKKVKGYNDDDG